MDRSPVDSSALSPHTNVARRPTPKDIASLQTPRVDPAIVMPVDINAKSSASRRGPASLAALAIGLTALLAGPLWAAPAPRESAPSESRESGERTARLSPDVKPQLDRSGRRRIGTASFYAAMFAGRKMADGSPMEPSGDNAASRTLPLGTTARVTNLKTGKAAIVTIRDRGPYVPGRIVDLSPATARAIGLDRRTGVTRVDVSPITVPMPNGEVKLGDAVLEANNRGRGPASDHTGSGTLHAGG
jgi:rare lipoprotein A